MKNLLKIAAAAALLASTAVVAFAFQPNLLHHRHLRLPRQLYSTSQSTDENNDDLSVIGVVAPLKYVGPYACLELEFPHLTKKAENEEAVSIDFGELADIL